MHERAKGHPVRRRSPATSAAATPHLVQPWRILLLIMFAGGMIRLVALRSAPPGLNQDEAANAWNAWCILKTGMDQTGERWPVFATRCHGGYSCCLQLYWMMPFQALGGMNVWTTRLPFAVAGLITIPLLYYVGKRMFGSTVGLIAAGLIAVSPWHVQQSRWGHEAALCPVLVAGTLAAMLWARLPISDDQHPPRFWPALLAGALAGLSLYGYQAMRLFLPAFMALAILVTLPAWWQHLKTSIGRRAIAGFILAGAAVAGPLVWEHVARPNRIGRQLAVFRLWKEGDPLHRKAMAVARRYPGHFGPDFLFISGDQFAIHAPPGSGQFQFYALPLFLAGIVAAFRDCTRSRAARVLLAAVGTYPLGDCFAYAPGMHALRSLPGLPGLILLAAVGAVAIAAWLYRLHPRLVRTTAVVFSVIVLAFTGHFLWLFFGRFSRDPVVYHPFHTDLVEACEWLKPRLAQADAVFCTTDTLNMPYAITLVILNYDPAQWLRDEHHIDTSHAWDLHKRYGKMFFVYDTAGEEEYRRIAGEPGKRLLVILRADVPFSVEPAYTVTRPDGLPTLRIYDFTTR